MLQNRLFSAVASRSGLGAPVSDAVARRSIVFCSSVFADRIEMAASRLLLAAAARVILLSFAAEDRNPLNHSIEHVYLHFGSSIWVSSNDLTVLPNPGMMVNKGNHPQMAELFRLLKS